MKENFLLPKIKKKVLIVIVLMILTFSANFNFFKFHIFIFVLDGASHVSKGWLINQYEIQLRLYSNPIVLYPDYLKNGSFSVRCDAIDLCKSYVCRLEHLLLRF